MEPTYRATMREYLGIDDLAAQLLEHETNGQHGGGGEPGPVPVPVEERIIPMFEAGEVQAFIKDFDFTTSDKLVSIGGYCRGETVSVWLHAKDLTGNSGALYIVPNPIQELIRFGGLRNEVKGSVRFWNDEGTDQIRGDAEWYAMTDGRYAIRFRFVDEFSNQANDGKVKTMKASPDYPFNFQYGVHLNATLTLI
jgi:hypothetical protein